MEQATNNDGLFHKTSGGEAIEDLVACTNRASLIEWGGLGQSRPMAAYLKAFEARFNAEGSTREQVATEFFDRMQKAPNFEQKILDKLNGKPGGLSLTEVRAAVGGQAKAKAEFDQAVLSLYKSRLVYLDRHDHPLRLSDAERRELVFDGEGNYYVGITLRSDVE